MDYKRYSVFSSMYKDAMVGTGLDQSHFLLENQWTQNIKGIGRCPMGVSLLVEVSPL